MYIVTFPLLRNASENSMYGIRQLEGLAGNRSFLQQTPCGNDTQQLENFPQVLEVTFFAALHNKNIKISDLDLLF